MKQGGSKELGYAEPGDHCGKTVSAIYLFSFGSKGPLKYLPVYDAGAGSL